LASDKATRIGAKFPPTSEATSREAVEPSKPKVKIMKAKIKTTLLAVLTSVTLTAQLHADLQYGDFYYTTDGVNATITHYIGSGGAVNIPGTINVLTVVSIGDGAFSSQGGITSITIPDSVTNIGASAFYDCTNLTQITIPNAVTSIGRYAFEYCSNLTSVTIPASVTSVGTGAFADCSALTTALFQGNAPLDGGMIFDGDANSVVYYLSGTTGWGSIYGDTFVAQLSVPGFKYMATNGVITITHAASGVFGTDPIPATIGGLPVTTIGVDAFFEEADMDGVIIPDTVTSIEDSAFYGCTALTSVTIPDSVTNIGMGAFEYCSHFISITIPAGVTRIAFDAFANCANLTSVTISAGVTSIGIGAFIFCNSLTDVTIPNTVTSIGTAAFSDCTSLTNVVIPASVTSVGTNAFGSCYSLTSALFQGNAPSNDGTAFNGDANIVYYLSGTTGWGSNYGGVTAQALVVPEFDYTATNGVITITGYTGSGGAVDIPNAVGGLPVTAIGADAFYNNTGLASVTIPDNVAGIGQGAFAGCSDLGGVYFLGNPPGSGNDSSVFSSDAGVTVYYLPEPRAGVQCLTACRRCCGTRMELPSPLRTASLASTSPAPPMPPSWWKLAPICQIPSGCPSQRTNCPAAAPLLSATRVG
jgi:BspA type Leucine rich repeat region (6 copies)